jgi:hypothetical protein
MTTSIEVPMSSLVNTMLIRRWEELNVVEGNACNYYCPTWKPTSHTMATKVWQVASWVLVCLLPWKQCRRWIPIGSMGCVHTHWRMHAFEGWGSSSRVRSVVQKTKENNQKVRKISWAINQAPTPRPKHDKIQAQWASNVMSKSMLKRVWWCKHSEMES